MLIVTNASARAPRSAKRKPGGQPGNTNAFELSGHKPHQRSAKRHEHSFRRSEEWWRLSHSFIRFGSFYFGTNIHGLSGQAHAEHAILRALMLSRQQHQAD